MPEPKGQADVRRYLGMCNYLARYIPKLSEESKQLRKLTESESEFIWGDKEKQAFLKLKDLIAKQQLLAFYDVRKPVVLQCDASTEDLPSTGRVSRGVCLPVPDKKRTKLRGFGAGMFGHCFCLSEI